MTLTLKEITGIANSYGSVEIGSSQGGFDLKIRGDRE